MGSQRLPADTSESSARPGHLVSAASCSLLVQRIIQLLPGVKAHVERRRGDVGDDGDVAVALAAALAVVGALVGVAALRQTQATMRAPHRAIRNDSSEDVVVLLPAPSQGTAACPLSSSVSQLGAAAQCSRCTCTTRTCSAPAPRFTGSMLISSMTNSV